MSAAPTTSPTQPSSESSAWAATAFMPDDSPEHTESQEMIATHMQRDLGKDEMPTICKELATDSRAWPDPSPSISSPMLLGHANELAQRQDQGHHHPHTLHISVPLSPITPGPTNRHTLTMNDQYSYHQMYDLDNTILLPLNVVNHLNVLYTVPPPH